MDIEKTRTIVGNKITMARELRRIIFQKEKELEMAKGQKKKELIEDIKYKKGYAQALEEMSNELLTAIFG